MKFGKRPNPSDRAPGWATLRYPRLESGRVDWEIVARNGEVIGGSKQPDGFADLDAAQRAAHSFVETVFDALAPGNDFYLEVEG